MSDDIIPASPSSNTKNKNRKFRRRKNVKNKSPTFIMDSKQSEDNNCSPENIAKIFSDFSSLFPRCSQWFEEIPDHLKVTENEDQLKCNDDVVIEQYKSDIETPKKGPIDTVYEEKVLFNEVPVPLECDLITKPINEVPREIEDTIHEEKDLFIEVPLECDLITEPQKTQNGNEMITKGYGSVIENQLVRNSQSAKYFTQVVNKSVNNNQLPVISTHVQLDLKTNDSLSQFPVEQSEIDGYSPIRINLLYENNDPNDETSATSAIPCFPFFARAKILECANLEEFTNIEPPKAIAFPPQQFQSAKQLASQHLPSDYVTSETDAENRSSQELNKLLDESISHYFPELTKVPENNDSATMLSKNDSDYKSMLDEDQDWFDNVVLQLHPNDNENDKKQIEIARNEKINLVPNTSKRVSDTIIQNMENEVIADDNVQIVISNATKRKFDDIILSPRKPLERIVNGANLLNGFKTAGGNKIPISTMALKKSSKMFKTINEEFLIANENYSDNEIPIENKSFKMMSGQSISDILPTRQLKPIAFITSSPSAPELLQNNHESYSQMLTKEVADITRAFLEDENQNYKWSQGPSILTKSNANTSDRICNGFQTAGGNKISISTNALKRSRDIFNDIENEFSPDKNLNHTTPNVETSNAIDNKSDRICNGFQTADGINISISTNTLKRSRDIFNDIEKEFSIDKNSNHTTPNVETSGVSDNKSDRICNGFQTAGGNKILISTNALKRSRDIFNDIENEFPIDNGNSNVNTFKANDKASDHMFKGFQTAGGNEISISTNAIKRSREIFKEVEKEFPIDKQTNQSIFNSSHSFLSPSASKFSRGPLMTSTPVITIQNGDIYSPGFTKELNDMTKALLDDEMASCSNIIDDQLQHFKPLPSRLKPTCLSTVFESFERENNLPINVSNDVIINRHYALRTQQYMSKDRDRLEMSISCQPGYLYKRKLHSSKIALKFFVNSVRPFCEQKTIKDDNAVDLITIITNETFNEFKFNMIDHYPLKICQENTDGIQLNDDILLIMNEHSQVGYTELQSAFFACPSIDPLKISISWYDNHLKWILWKFIALEYAFPYKFRRKLLSPENVLEQLKYRYDRDVSRTEKSSIRKLIENNGKLPYDRPLFVCFVSKILSDSDIELSDGWYAINCKLDAILCAAMTKKKIQIGTKLIIFQTEIVTDLPVNCSVLQIPSNVQLKINANACRRVKWDTKLGLYKLPHSFYIKLSSIYMNGGIIGCIRVQVIRIISTHINDKVSSNKPVLRKRQHKSTESPQPNKSLKLNNKTPSPKNTLNCRKFLMSLEICDINLPLKVFLLNVSQKCGNNSREIHEQSIIEVTNLIACDAQDYEMQLITNESACIKVLS